MWFFILHGLKPPAAQYYGGDLSLWEELEQPHKCERLHPVGAAAQVAKHSSFTIKQLCGTTVNTKSYGNLILRLSKQIWHQTFCPAEAGGEADAFAVALKQNAQDSQITVFVEEHLINS